MAKAFKCDICNRYYDAYNTKKSPTKISGIVPVNVDADGKYWANPIVHMCPDCTNAMLKLFDELGGVDL